MGNPIAARKNSNFKAVSTAPSFNKTPVGNSTPPLPYGTTQDLGNSVSVVPTVRLNGDPAYALNQTTQPSCKGDDPGVAKGVKSGTVNGKVTPTQGSTTVRMGGKPIIRQGDPCTMNGGNNPGVYITTQKPSASSAKHAAGNADPTIKLQTPPEKSFLEKASDAAKSAGQVYKDKVSQSLHDFAGNAMDTGGTIAAAGGTTAAVGGGMVATGIGAAPGAAMVAGGGATAAVGGGVSAVGAVTETVATGLDAAADFATSGKLPNMVGMATAYAERMVMNKIDKLTRLIPGSRKSSKPQAKKESDTEQAKPKPAGNGTKIIGEGYDDSGRCKLRPYDEIKAECKKKGMDAHHVVPNRAFQLGKRKDNKLMPGGVPESDGLAICLESNKNGLEAEHTRAHKHYDKAEKLLAEDTSSEKGLALLGQVEDEAAKAVEKATDGKCSKENIQQQLREHHQKKYKLNSNTKVRATKNPSKLPEDTKGQMGRRGRIKR